MAVDHQSRFTPVGPRYLEVFNLTERPFSITPDPRYTYFNATMKMALSHGTDLIEGRRGLGCIDGEIGTGKTTLARYFAMQAGAAGHNVAFIYQAPGGARQTESKWFSAIADDLRLPRANSAERTLAQIQTAAAEKRAEGNTTVVIIDDAHRIRAMGISALLALLNLQSSDEPLIQVVLFGQYPEIVDVLRSDRAFHSRLALRTTLTPMTRRDVAAMVQLRLREAGRDDELFDETAIDALYFRSRGIPRIICTIADRACTIASERGPATTIGAEDVVEASQALLHDESPVEADDGGQ